MSHKAFTLIEVLIVMVVLGVLAGVAIPVYRQSIIRADRGEALHILEAIRDSEIRYYSQNGRYALNMDKLDFKPTDVASSGQALKYDYAVTTGFGDVDENTGDLKTGTGNLVATAMRVYHDSRDYDPCQELGDCGVSLLIESPDGHVYLGDKTHSKGDITYDTTGLMK